jgi:hypothetical protein
MPQTRMTKPFDLRAGLYRALTHLTLAFTLVASLAACGPGTGGTGTGPITPTVGFSGGVSGTTTGGTTSGTAAGGAIATPPAAPCTADCPQAHLRLDTERVELAAPCLRFVFTGSWAVDAGGVAVLAGTLETARGTATATSKAALRLQFSSAGIDSAQVNITLSNDAGNALLGPATLVRNDAAPGGTALACGPS